jgi:hypothetical protein
VAKRLVMGLGGFTDATDYTVPFLNRMKYSRNTAGIRVDGVDYTRTEAYAEGWLDDNFELLDPMPSNIEKIYIGFGSIAVDPVSLAGLDGLTEPAGAVTAFKITWDEGDSVTAFNSEFFLSNIVPNLAERYATFTIAGIGNLRGSLSLSGTSSPPVNIKVYKTALESNIDAGELFEPDFIADAKQWGILRLMDWQSTNGNTAVDFADLATESYFNWQNGSDTTGNKVGLPVSVIAELAHVTGRPIWVCIPHAFTDSAVEEFAEYLRDNVDTPIWYEYSNEVWNTIFSQTAYAVAQGGSTFNVGVRWAGKRASEISRIIRSVYGEDSGSRWVGVLGTQNANTGITDLKILGIDDHISDQPGVTAGQLFSHIGVTNYMGYPGLTTAASGTGQTFSGWIDTTLTLNDNYAYFRGRLHEYLLNTSTQVGDLVTLWESHLAKGQAEGISGIVCYEGGTHVVANNPLRDNLSGETEGDKINLAICKWGMSPELAHVEYVTMEAFMAIPGAYAPAKFVDRGYHNKFGTWGAKRWHTDTANPVWKSCQVWNRRKGLAIGA